MNVSIFQVERSQVFLSFFLDNIYIKITQTYLSLALMAPLSTV